MCSHALLQGNLLDPGIEPASLTSPALAGRFFTESLPGKPMLDLSTFRAKCKSFSVTCSSQSFESYCLMGALDTVWILTDYLNCKYFPSNFRLSFYFRFFVWLNRSVFFLVASEFCALPERQVFQEHSPVFSWVIIFLLMTYPTSW